MKISQKGGAKDMEELYTVDEMMSRLKVSRETMYNWMKAGIIPYVQISGKRRFVASQVMRAIKMMQQRQAQGTIRSVQNYTLSDVNDGSSNPNPSIEDDLRLSTKPEDNIPDCKNVKRRKAV